MVHILKYLRMRSSEYQWVCIWMHMCMCVHRNTTRCIKVVCRGGNENICHLNFIIRRHNAQHLSIEHKVATATTAAQQQNTFKIFNTISAYGTFYNNQQRTMCGTSTFLLCTVLMLLFVLGLNEWRHKHLYKSNNNNDDGVPKNREAVASAEHLTNDDGKCRM